MADTSLEAYQEWLFGLIELDDLCDRYWQLLIYLSGKEFRWKVRHDDNRNDDGLSLRKEFFEAKLGVFPDFLAKNLPFESSCLEIMVALARRIEEIVYDPAFGDRTAVWFWQMVKNLGLDGMERGYFDRDYCDEIVERWLNRRYDRDGHGSLFVTDNPCIDQRKSEIWYQMNEWIEENFLI